MLIQDEETIDEEMIVVVVKENKKIRWYRSERELWVLDVNKWKNGFRALGYDVPDSDDDFRFGLHIVDQQNADYFLKCMSRYEISKESLSSALSSAYPSAASWWDVQHLFPIMFVDFDECTVGAFYPDGICMERHLPDNWSGEFIDFANEYSEDKFPSPDKFWVQDGQDLLALLNQRGAASI
ncbi:group-specific protein [Acinetobacter dispersus]|uniref:group-specific protein n=1 Tax=Acinetobacter dispersus TaxID=70348 RepID=UPI001F4B78F7|nr:group-specific protein [Acinetobacter dispersus]MCH7392664.1 group-specific protein [Acinetobacter dispersus]